MKKNNYIIAILNIIFFIISLLSRTLFENNYMRNIIKPTIIFIRNYFHFVNNLY